ncbi:MAG: hypothetical protein WC716_09860 [Chitinophagaceae bacterium]|jgi:hypothetical protein
MKKLFALITLMFCVHLVKAQFTTVKITNSSRINDLYVRFEGSNNPLVWCTQTNGVSNTGPIPLGGSVIFTLASVTWVPAPPPAVISFSTLAFSIIPPIPPTVFGPVIGFCPFPPSGSPYIFSNGFTVFPTYIITGTQVEVVL